MWKAKLKDGQEVSEINTKWSDISQNVTELLLVTKNNQIITLPRNMSEYIQAKTASAEMGSNNVQIESRYVGFKLGNNTVRIRVNEKTNNISIEVE